MRRKIVLAVLPLLAFVSCQKEKADFHVGNSEMSSIMVETESSATKCEQEEGLLFADLPYVTSTGDTLYLSATVSEMEDVVVDQTKGSPIPSSEQIPGNKFYTYVFEDSGAYTSTATTPTGTTNLMSKVPIAYSDSKWSFDKRYFWPDDEDKVLHFVSLGPSVLVDSSNVYHVADGASGYGWQTSGKTLKGRFQSRKDDVVTDNDALNLTDLIYAYDSQSKTTYDSSVRINFKHACVGVRFEIGNIFGTIESMALKNFYRNADFSVSSTGLIWSNWGFKTEFKQVYGVSATPSQAGEDIDKTSNHAKTFMVVPQTLPSDAAMIIKIGNTLHPEELSFDKICTANPSLSRDWTTYQGKIITFRLSSDKANNVSVAITDVVDGKTKKDIVITNDGRSDIMIRVKPVGNWLNAQNQVLAAWDENTPYGTFTSSNGFPALDNVCWKKSSDGFYYYKKYLKSGKVVSQNLFDTFTVTSKPVDSTGTWEEGGAEMKITQFELVLLVQAVIAETDLTSFKAAWGTEMVSWIGTPVSDE